MMWKKMQSATGLAAREAAGASEAEEGEGGEGEERGKQVNALGSLECCSATVHLDTTRG